LRERNLVVEGERKEGEEGKGGEEEGGGREEE